MALTYFINRKQTVCVVTVNGTLAETDSEILQKCLDEVLLEQASYVVLNFGAFSMIEPGMAKAFTIFQQNLRGKSKIVLCNLAPKIRTQLNSEGIIRDSEVQTDLMASLQAILKWEKGDNK